MFLKVIVLKIANYINLCLYFSSDLCFYFKIGMSILINKTVFICSVLLLLVVPVYGCSSVAQEPDLIKKLEASNLYVYPQGTSTITCIAEDVDGGDLTYYWSCDEGSFAAASGRVVTWKSPNKYGKFHIMVTVNNGSGIVDKASMDIEVVVNRSVPQCPSCGR